MGGNLQLPHARFPAISSFQSDIFTDTYFRDLQYKFKALSIVYSVDLAFLPLAEGWTVDQSESDIGSGHV